MKLAVFIHAATLSRCQERVDEYYELCKKSGLLDAVETIFVDCVGTGELPLSNDPKVIITRIHEDMTENEAPTHKHMYEFAKENPEYKLLYIHTKGVGKEINHCIEDWIHYMTYFLIERWSTCVDLLDTSSAVGVDLREDFHLHYSGNFWWARADHLSRLVDPYEFRDQTKYPNKLNSIRHAQEFWVASVQSNYSCLWDSRIPVYARHLHLYPRSLYESKDS